MATMNLSLPDEMKAFVDSQVEKSGYATPEEYVRALLREAQERENDRQDLRAQLLEALEDEPIPMVADDWDRIRAELDRRAEARREDVRGATKGPGQGR